MENVINNTGEKYINHFMGLRPVVFLVITCPKTELKSKCLAMLEKSQKIRYYSISLFITPALRCNG